MKIKTSELQGAALNWAVAKCEGIEWWAAEYPKDGLFIDYERTRPYSSSTDWAQGGPIIEREGISVAEDHDGRWRSGERLMTMHHYGPTPLIAAMRCYVACKMGEEVDVPDALLQADQQSTDQAEEPQEVASSQETPRA